MNVVMNGGGAVLWMAVVFLAGIGLGAVFFGGLWLTTRRFVQLSSASDSPQPSRSPRPSEGSGEPQVSPLLNDLGGHLLVVLSFMARTALVVLGMFWLTRGDWRLILVCLAGFLIARTVILRVVSNQVSRLSQNHSPGEWSKS